MSIRATRSDEAELEYAHRPAITTSFFTHATTPMHITYLVRLAFVARADCRWTVGRFDVR